MTESPKFDCAWTCPRTLSSYLSYSRPGNRSLLNGHHDDSAFRSLPESLRQTMHSLSFLSLAMDEQRSFDIDGFNHLRNARCAVHYQVLSLPATLPIQQHTSSGSDTIEDTLYQCCRLTTILFSNAIIVSMPPQTGWDVVLLPQLQAVLQRFAPPAPTQFTRAAHVWSLVLGAIAAEGSESRCFFVRSLQEACTKYAVTSWACVTSILESMIWSTSSCRKAMKRLFEEAGIDNGCHELLTVANAQ